MKAMIGADWHGELLHGISMAVIYDGFEGDIPWLAGENPHMNIFIHDNRKPWHSGGLNCFGLN